MRKPLHVDKIRYIMHSELICVRVKIKRIIVKIVRPLQSPLSHPMCITHVREGKGRT